MNEPQKENKFLWIWEKVIFPIMIFVFTIFIAPLLWEYYVTIRPNIINIDKNIQSMNNSISLIESRYTKKDVNGMDCKVGITSEMSGNSVAMPESNKYNLKGADVIYVTNPYSPYSPTMRFTVYLKENTSNNDSKCDFFLSKEAMERLDINKKEFYKGVFNMKIHIEKKQQN